MTIHGRARFQVMHGKQEEFEVAALGLQEAAVEESGTLNYRWYSSKEPGIHVVLEEYSDSVSFRAHIENQEALMNRLERCAELLSVELYGPLEPQLRNIFSDDPKFTLFDELPTRAGG